MPVIRFVREGRDVECYPGENLREVALREGIELYGLKGMLGNCGDRKSTRLNSSHVSESRMPSSA